MSQGASEREEGEGEGGFAHEHVLVILEGKLEVDNQGVLDLLQQLPLLNDILDCLHFNTLFLVDVLERVEFLVILLLHYPHLTSRTKFSKKTKKDPKIGAGLTFPKAPRPMARRS